MCFNKKIDDVLKQIKNCHDPVEKWRLLRDFNSCTSCPEEKQTHNVPCRCSRHQQTELMNLIEHIRQQHAITKPQKHQYALKTYS